jgi:hypothetical protein
MVLLLLLPLLLPSNRRGEGEEKGGRTEEREGERGSQPRAQLTATGRPISIGRLKRFLRAPKSVTDADERRYRRRRK